MRRVSRAPRPAGRTGARPGLKKWCGHAGGVEAADELGVFAGVAGAEDGELDEHHVAHLPVAFDAADGFGEDPVEEFDGLGALDGDHGGA